MYRSPYAALGKLALHSPEPMAWLARFMQSGVYAPWRGMAYGPRLRTGYVDG
jgi:hypothetical protein